MSESDRARGGKWVSQRILAQQTTAGRDVAANGSTGGSAGARRVAPPPPRSSGTPYGDAYHPLHSNSSHSTASNSSPTMQSQQHYSAAGVNNPSSSVHNRFPALTPANGSSGGNGAGGAHGRRPYASLFTDAGDVAPPQPRSVQMGAQLGMAAGKAGGSVPPGAGAHSTQPTGRPAAPHASYVPAPRHSNLHHTDPNPSSNAMGPVLGTATNPNSTSNSSKGNNHNHSHTGGGANQVGGGVTNRWAQLGSAGSGAGGTNSGCSHHHSGGNHGRSGSNVNGGVPRTPSASGNMPGSLSASNSGPFSKSDLGGFGAPQGQASAGGRPGSSSFRDGGLTSGSGVGSGGFIPPLPREQQQQQQLAALQHQQMALFQQFQQPQQPMSSLLAQGSNGVPNPDEANAGQRAALSGALGNGTAALPAPQEQLLAGPGGVPPSMDLNVVMRMLMAGLAGSDGGQSDGLAGNPAGNEGFAQPSLPFGLQQPNFQQGTQLQPQHGQPPATSAADLMALLTQPVPDPVPASNPSMGSMDGGADSEADASEPTVSFQEMVDMLLGTANGVESGSASPASKTPGAEDDAETATHNDNLNNILAALTRGMDASPQASPTPQQQQESGEAGRQLFDFGTAFAADAAGAASTAAETQPSATAASDPIAAALFSQLTGDADGPTLDAQMLSQPAPQGPPPPPPEPSVPESKTPQSRGGSIPLPQPRSSNLRDQQAERASQGTAAADPQARSDVPTVHLGTVVENEAWPSLAALDAAGGGLRSTNTSAASFTPSKPVSMAQALMSGSHRPSASSSGVWRQVASHGTSAVTSPLTGTTATATRPAAPGQEPSAFTAPTATATLQKDLSLSVQSTASGTRRSTERSPMVPLPATAAAAAATTPLTDGSGRSSQPHTPAGAVVRPQRASLEAPTVTRTTIACIFRETPQSMARRDVAAGNRDRPSALCRAPTWPPSNEGEVDRLLKSKDANKLLRHLTIIHFSRQHVKGVQELFDSWARNGIPAPDMGFGAYYFYVKEKSDKLLCMKHNGRGATPGHGYGKCDFESRRPNSTCRYEHVCLFCRSKEHGWFEEAKCEGYQQLLSEVERLGVLETDVEVMLNAMEKASAWSH